MRNASLRRTRAHQVLALILLVGCAIGWSDPAPRSTPAPGEDQLVHVAFMGDFGSGSRRQAEVRDQLVGLRAVVPLQRIFTVGDNIYDRGESRYIKPRFLDMYAPLFHRGVRFHAALGNHDVEDCDVVLTEILPRDGASYANCEVAAMLDPQNRFGFLAGQRYYSVILGQDPPVMEVFVLDANTLAQKQSEVFKAGREDTAQISWLESALEASTAYWKVVTLHVPIHSPESAGKWYWPWKGHGADEPLREQLERVFRRHGVDVVVAGHNHFYARMVPQYGIRYFVTGGGGKDVYRHKPEPGYVVQVPDRGKFHHFLYLRVGQQEIHYYAIDSEGETRDSGRFGKGDGADHPAIRASPLAAKQ